MYLLREYAPLTRFYQESEKKIRYPLLSAYTSCLRSTRFFEIYVDFASHKEDTSFPRVIYSVVEIFNEIIIPVMRGTQQNGTSFLEPKFGNVSRVPTRTFHSVIVATTLLDPRLRLVLSGIRRTGHT